MATPETSYYGFTRVGQGESISKNGNAALDSDNVIKDVLFHSMEMHQHTGAARLADPTLPPGLSPSVTGGQLSADTTFYYVIGLIDQWGLETAASPEQSVTTAAQLAPPGTPSLVVETSGGSVVAGQYSYVITYQTADGSETTPSAFSAIQVESGTSNRIRVVLPSLITGATGWRIYRRRPGQGQYYYLGTSATTPFYDSGSPEDSTIVAPVYNTTNRNNSVTVEIPGATIPTGVYGWRIYRATDPGGYDGNCLVHEVVEPTSELGVDLTTTWVDTGAALQEAGPRVRSSTVGGGKVITYSQLSGSIPLSQMPRGARSMHFVRPGTVTNGLVIAKTEIPQDIVPTKITAYFQTVPSGISSGATPPSMKFRLADSRATPAYIELACVGDSNYYKTHFTLTDHGTFEAESGTRSNVSAVVVAQDATASNTQAIYLSNSGDYVEVNVGNLEAGTYQFSTRARYQVLGASPNMDLSLAVYNATDLGTPLAITNVGTVGTLYGDLVGPSYTLTSTTQIVVRALKTTTGASSWLIDTLSYLATSLVTLQAGDITLSAITSGSPSTFGSDVNFTVWY